MQPEGYIVRILTVIGILPIIALGAATASHAKTFNYHATLNDLSGLGGSGTAKLQYDDVANTLRVNIEGTGFAPNMLHVQHIHGTFDDDGNVTDAVTPTLANDTDGDGVVELLEGLPLYGGILLSLFDETDTDNGFNGFPNVTDEVNGSFSFTAFYDLASTTALSDGISAADLFPLDKREIVIHGAFLAPGIGGVGNEDADSDLIRFGGYSAFVPVAAGEIVAVDPIPLPAAAWMLLAGIGGLGALSRRGKGPA
jgi:hypothetical protein